jgi:hypothetical protein
MYVETFKSDAVIFTTWNWEILNQHQNVCKFIGNLYIFALISQSGISSMNELTQTLKVIVQCDVADKNNSIWFEGLNVH